MENIIDQVKQIATEADVITRKRLKVLLRDLLYSLEDDDDIVQRIGYLVSPLCFLFSLILTLA